MRKIADVWLQQIINLLYERQEITRPEIRTATGLNAASVSLALRHLLQVGSIVKVGEQQLKRGRNREIFRLNSEGAFFIAVDLEGICIRFGLMTLLGDIRYRWSENIQPGELLKVERVAAGIERVMENLNPQQRKRVIAVGISHPGILNRQNRITAFNLHWVGYDLAGPLQKRIGLPCFLEVAGHVCILAERWLGTAKGCSNCVFLIAGVGVGVGAYVDGHLLLGAKGVAGELGHTTVDSEARDLCTCGNRGCLESIVSSPNIVRQYLEKTGKDVKLHQKMHATAVFDLARSGDPFALEVIDRAGKFLGLAIANLVNLLNPELVVLGGDLLESHDLFLPRIRKQLERHLLSKSVEAVRITISSLGTDIGLRGAASLAFQRSLQDTDILNRRLCCRPTAGMGTKPRSGQKGLALSKA